MKITPNQLAQHLKTQLLPVYLISGDEPLLAQEAAALIIEHCKTLEYTEHLHFTQEPNFNWENLWFTAQHLSLFDDKRILELKLTNLKIANGEKILTNFVDRTSFSSILLMLAPKLDNSAQKSSWFKALEKNAGVIQVWPLESQQLTTWLSKRIKTKGMEIDREGLNFLLNYTQGNLLALNQEIEKLSLMYGANSITSTQIVTAITDNSHFTVFDLVDCALQGKSQNVVRIMQRLQQEGLEPAIILWALAKELRTLITCATSEQELPKVMWKRQSLVKHALHKHALPKLQQLLKHAAQIDLYIKGAKEANVWNELTQLSLKLAGAN